MSGCESRVVRHGLGDVRMSPTCQSCGNHVSERFVRVVCPPGREDPLTCPHRDCDKLVRVNGQVRRSFNFTGDLDVEVPGD